MSWDAEDVVLLKNTLNRRTELRADRAPSRVCGYTVCAKSTGLGLKRAHKPPTSKPKIASTEVTAGVAGCLCPPVAKVVSRKTVVRQPKKFTKRRLYAMLADGSGIRDAAK